MNDRFKFRIFEKETKIMVELDAVGYSSFDPFKEGKSRLIMIPSGLGNTFYYDKQCLYDNEKFSKPMQCTGLKDNNGKLIYEKDILLSPDNDEPYMVIVEWDNEKGYIVKAWNGKEFEYALSDDTLESLKYFQIIGNEFENPELLEGNNE